VKDISVELCLQTISQTSNVTGTPSPNVKHEKISGEAGINSLNTSIKTEGVSSTQNHGIKREFTEASSSRTPTARRRQRYRTTIDLTEDDEEIPAEKIFVLD
jgi:hypothetical protein